MTKKHLTLQDREKLEALYLDGHRVEHIVEKLDVHRATIYTELKRGYTGKTNRNGRTGYSAAIGQQKIHENRLRPFGSQETEEETNG